MTWARPDASCATRRGIRANAIAPRARVIDAVADAVAARMIAAFVVRAGPVPVRGLPVVAANASAEARKGWRDAPIRARGVRTG